MKKHGESYTRLYAVWKSMRQRCQNERHHAYSRYGGRGISVCDEWQDYETFKEWAMRSGYDQGASGYACSLDRVDNDGDYCPENCRWVDYKVQANNRSDYKIANSQPVVQIDGQGNIVKRFPSLTRAENATGVARHAIADACGGLRAEAGGFRWEYAVH